MLRSLAAFLILCLALPAYASDPVPERRLAVTTNVDFFGGDVASFFDVTLERCQAACLADGACQAFTFNRRSNACFLKSDVSEQTPYEGAVSAIVIDAEPGAISTSAARAADLSFLDEADLSMAKTQAQGLGLEHPANGAAASDLIAASRARQAAGDPLGALRLLGAAISLTDGSDLWADYASLSLAEGDRNGNQRRRMQSNAKNAAINAYLRASTNGARVWSLLTLARSLEAQGRGRDMIPALRLAQSIEPRAEVSAQLDRAINTYGFRVIETQVNNNAARPRICAVMSEDLAGESTDYRPFVQLPTDDLAVTAEGRQLCIEGVQHGERYRIALREGLPAKSGETLSKSTDVTLYVADRDPSVRFPGWGYVLPKTDTAALPIETVNADTVDLTLRRVSDRNLLRAIQEDFFGRPLPAWQQDRFGADLSEELWTGTGDVQNTLNRDMTTRLPMDEIIAPLPAGVYVLQAAIPGADPYETPAAMQWFVISDLGLTTLSGTDGLHVFVRGLSDAAARKDVAVTLISRANSVLAEAVTDADGYARFAEGLTLGTGGSAPALVTVKSGEDMAFLSLTDPAFDLSDRGVEGRPPAPPIDVFLTTDRGAYRPGETVHLTALARDGQAAAIDALPLTAILMRPDGVEYSRHLSADPVAGGHVLSMPLADAVPRGTWRIELKADLDGPALAETRILVEDFLPERLDFTLDLPETVALGDRPPLAIEARYLFGAPAADLRIEGDVVLRAASGLDAFPGYTFGRADQPLQAVATSLPFDQKTDAEGRATLPVTLPDLTQADRPLELDVTTRVAEGSGRPVERSVTRIVLPDTPMIGIKPQFDGTLGQGAIAAFDLIAIGPDQAPFPMEVTWTLNRLETRYQWYSLNGRWQWEPTTTRTRISTGTAALGDAATAIETPVDWGQYELRVERTDGAFAAASTTFSAGWYAAADASATPDTLELSLDQPQYSAGDTATLRLVPRAAGTALVQVMSNRLIAMKAVEVTEGENLIPLDVTDEWGTGAYVTATVIRPLDAPAGRNPSRALGLAHATIDPGAKALNATLTLPETAQPRAPLTSLLTVEGIAPGETAYATVAAVDLGILNLTGFDAPDPQGHYFGQRRLGMSIRDIYGRLIDGLNGTMGTVRSGGDATRGLDQQAPPPEDLVSFFSGPVTIGLDGTAEVPFDLPAFNGTVRVMAVVWSDTSVGQASADVIVRDPVVVAATTPRFLAPGDTTQLLLEVTHTEGPTGEMPLTLSATNLTLGNTPTFVTLGEGETQRLTVPIQAMGVGSAAIDIALTTPDGRILTQTAQLPVRQNDPQTLRTSRFTLDPGDSFTFDADVFAGLRAGSASATLSAGPLARLNVPGLLQTLDRYPYGCTEQVTSRALPLLYLNQVAVAMGQADDATLNARIATSVDQILARQAANGAFGLWSVGSGDLWLDAYVTDFLSRARAQGYAVPDLAFTRALDNLTNAVNYAPDFEEGGEGLAYALIVLAREGQAKMGDLRYYADVKADAFATPLARAQLGAALALYGDPARADAMFRKAAEPARDTGWRSDYGTGLRDAAAVLTLAIEAGSDAVDAETLIAALSRTPDRASTQEAAWTLLAAHALIDSNPLSGLSVDGAPVDGPLLRLMEGNATSTTVIANTSATAQPITLSTFGVPETPEPAGGTALRITRSYFTLEGAPVDPATVTAGQRLVTVLNVTPLGPVEARLMVDDPLPAGLEIDNPNLIRSGDTQGLDWLQAPPTQSTEFRADRFLAAVDWRSDKSFDLAYIVRAISPGTFHHPAASVEDMYRPTDRGWGATGTLTVLP
ncbi:alpha-2-macroglobulin family protein [Cognatishimia sp. MH4019]|uniref:alpha-2-macroglobulin family protein n=1 Tax=Cognatishimia sp. MH4019 TaxID=2854030 RepID=UPI001CD5215E|nr:alpha-2-macroglobulin family protein [Cognatishimia sp. MH4019]